MFLWTPIMVAPNMGLYLVYEDLRYGGLFCILLVVRFEWGFTRILN